MKKYKNIILLRDNNDGRIDAIIKTNESDIVIQNAINEAKNKFYELEEKNELPEYINCEYEFITEELSNKYNIEFIDFWNGQEVYY